MRYTSYLALAMALAAPALARPDGVGGHHGDHGAGHHVEHAGAAAPSTGYEQPASAYEQPAYEQSYDAPSTGYEQPAYEQSYEQPGYEASYDEPSSGYGTEAAQEFDMSTLLIPILIIAGLALLFPSVVTVPVDPNCGGAGQPACGRRRREAGDSSANLVERVQDIYLAVVESEECMERVACEVGGIAADAGLNKGMTKMAESYVPKKYQKMMKNFNSAKDCHKIKCGAF